MTINTSLKHGIIKPIVGMIAAAGTAAAFVQWGHKVVTVVSSAAAYSLPHTAAAAAACFAIAFVVDKLATKLNLGEFTKTVLSVVAQGATFYGCASILPITICPAAAVIAGVVYIIYKSALLSNNLPTELQNLLEDGGNLMKVMNKENEELKKEKEELVKKLELLKQSTEEKLVENEKPSGQIIEVKNLKEVNEQLTQANEQLKTEKKEVEKELELLKNENLAMITALKDVRGVLKTNGTLTKRLESVKNKINAMDKTLLIKTKPD